MITSALCNSYKQEILRGVHLDTDTYKLALIKTGHAGTFGKATTNYSQLGSDEVANGAGYTTGGFTLSGFSVGLTGDTAHLSFADPTPLANATLSADGFLIYNATQGDKAVVVVLFSNAPVASTNGPYAVDLPAAGASALIRIT